MSNFYRVRTMAGRFDHCVGVDAAAKRACELAGAPLDTPIDALRKEWGVTLDRITPAEARAVGFEVAP